jgi:sugar lactone lactonase YvrE
MKTVRMLALVFVLALGVGRSLSWADDLPKNVDFETLVTFPLAIEGLTGDDGNLYTTERGGNPCLVKRIHVSTKTVEVVGNIPAPCSPSGIAFDKDGFLLIADAPDIYKLDPTPSGAGPGPAASLFVTGLVPGANGIAVDRHGNFWTGDGTSGQGRVWKITPAGIVTEEFRIQPMGATNLEIGLSFGIGQVFGQDVTSVGRDARTLPPGLIDAARAATNTLGSQPLVANGLAFNRRGDLFVADTARGAIWKVRFKHNGELENHQTGCDIVFTENTLCLKNIYVAHPLLEGTDGIALDKEGNIWNSANERNAIVVVTEDKKVIEIFRNAPDNITHLRNTGPLEFPTSPFLLGKKFCTANSDGNRRDNSPAASSVPGDNVGELGGVGQPLGKISCMDKKLKIEGLPLPVK